MSDSAQATNKGNESGPAFPNPGLANESCQFQTDVTGMTLRDYFAAKALTGLQTRDWSHFKKGDEALIEQWGRSAYAVADAMLKARQA